MKNYAAKTVDQYISNAPIEARPKLNELRKLVKSTIPKAEENISWGIPFYKYKGMLGGYSAFKKHVSFGLGGPRLEQKDLEALEKNGYVTGSKIIQIKFDQKIPITIIQKLLKSQAALNEAKKAIK